MDKIEKLVFLEITNKQFTKFPSSDFYETYNLLNDEEQTEYSKISNEIHSIWNRMNTPEILNANKKYNSIHEFISENEVSPIIVKVINDFNLDLKTEISEQTKIISKKILEINFKKSCSNKNKNKLFITEAHASFRDYNSWSRVL
jgi:hypothetical protein